MSLFFYLFLEARAEILEFFLFFFFWKIWRLQKDVLKISENYVVKLFIHFACMYDSRSKWNLNRQFQELSTYISIFRFRFWIEMCLNLWYARYLMRTFLCQNLLSHWIQTPDGRPFVNNSAASSPHFCHMKPGKIKYN